MEEWSWTNSLTVIIDLNVGMYVTVTVKLNISLYFTSKTKQVYSPITVSETQRNITIAVFLRSITVKM